MSTTSRTTTRTTTNPHRVGIVEFMGQGVVSMMKDHPWPDVLSVFTVGAVGRAAAADATLIERLWVRWEKLQRRSGKKQQ